MACVSGKEKGEVMGKETGIQWTDHSWSPWRGCHKVSPGCDNCYAEAMSVRNPSVLGTWGEHGLRPAAAEAYWRAPLAWDRKADLLPMGSQTPRVFLGSLMDFCELRPDLVNLRRRVWYTISQCPNLDWLILTKRPQNFTACLDYDRGLLPWGDGWPNVWLGTTTEDRERLHERCEALKRNARNGADARIKFLSCEPLLEDIASDLERYLPEFCPKCQAGDAAGHTIGEWDRCHGRGVIRRGLIDWVIVGGESTQRAASPARHCDLEWIEGIVYVCQKAKIPVFVKQLGSRPLANGLGFILRDKDRHGGELDGMPAPLQVRQFPYSPVTLFD